jgi:hypothetical protein
VDKLINLICNVYHMMYALYISNNFIHTLVISVNQKLFHQIHHFSNICKLLLSSSS